MKSTITVLSGLLIMAYLMGCSTVKSTTSERQSEILSGSWEMEKWAGYASVTAAFPQGLPVLIIDTEALTVSGSNGCNSIMGKIRYDHEAATIQFYQIVSTKMFCQTVPESEFHHALGSVNSYRVTQEQLFLLKDNEEIMVLNRQAAP